MNFVFFSFVGDLLHVYDMVTLSFCCHCNSATLNQHLVFLQVIITDIILATNEDTVLQNGHTKIFFVCVCIF